MRVESRVAERRKTSGKSKNSIELLPSAQSSPKMKILLALEKMSWKKEIELFLQSVTSHEN